MDEENLKACEPVSETSRHNSLIFSDSQGRAGLEDVSVCEETDPEADYKWYVMRDLKRPNAKYYCCEQLEKKGFKVFLPKEKRVIEKNGKRKTVVGYILYNLFFIYSDRATLDPEVKEFDTLQYLYKRGVYHVPLVIPTPEMERFIHAVEGTDDPKFFLPEQILPSMLGKMVHITGGPLAGYEGRLLKAVGRAKKRLIVELSGILAVGVEVKPQYIEEIIRAIPKV